MPGVLSAIGDGYNPLAGELSSEIWQIEVLVRAIEQEEFNRETSIRAILSMVNVLCDTVGISPRSFQRSDIENAIDMMKELKLRWKALALGNSFEIVLKEE